MSKAELIRGGGEGSALWDGVWTAGGQAESLNGKVAHDCGSMLNDLAAGGFYYKEMDVGTLGVLHVL